MVDKILPNDPRIQYKTANLNGLTYSYILALPPGPPLNTIILIHGFPDLSLGWRYQIPFLTSLGLRVIVPDMLGYGGTDAPSSPSFYTYKRAADDIASLAKSLGLDRVILGGHDWGGAIVYRIAMWYPDLISAFFSVCTPFMPPKTKYVPATVLPNFKYQLQFGGEDLEKRVQSEEEIRMFLNAMYGARGPNGEPAFSVEHGYFIENGPVLQKSKLVTDEELDFYANQWKRNGMHGPTNWYRNGLYNFEDERQMARRFEGKGYVFQIPVLFIAGKRDAALPPRMSGGMEKWFRNLTRGEVDASHWALWERPEEVNRLIGEWLVGQIAMKANL